MKKFLFILLAIIFFLPSLLIAQISQKKTINLEECYKLALNWTERVPISNEEINQARARYTQALGFILPKITLEISEFLQDPSQSGTEGTSFANTFTRFSTPEVRFNMKQPIFHGLQEVYGLRKNRALEGQRQYDKENVQRLLYRDVAITYYTIAQIEMDIQTNEKILSVLKEQLGDLKKRVDLGKSRISEQTAQEAAMALVEADIERRKGDQKVGYDMLTFLTGLDPAPQIDIKELFNERRASLDHLLSYVDRRPDIQASRKQIEVASHEEKIRRGAFLPQGDADVNYYLYRVGFPKGIDWDITLSLSIPIFNFATFGQLREAKSLYKQAQLQTELARRTAVNDIRKAYDTYQFSVSQFKKYATATEKAEKSYYQQVADFRLNLITNLDVLQTQRVWFDALRSREQTRVQTWLDWFNLQIAAGMKP